MKRPSPRKSVCYALACLCVLTVACAPVYLDPGPNPARVEVELTAKVDPALLEHPREYIYWDWGLNLEVPSGPLPLLQPTEPQNFKVIPNVNPLVRKVVFLAPTGKRTYLFEVSGYVFRTRGDGVAPVTLLAYEQKLELDLKPGQTYRIKRDLTSAR
ncbi:MAG: hypothetical protein KJ720_09490 [Proteobacteria bacterium]|nr:hypothetical protein [Pseudomonadota bacterium]MBU1452785.1 hypothetical protein [Pseudomonadota bacterium]MBU2469098.1 hypothetical protein [Pseudomonadota bacterium]MBU2519435.1 hypothetical protein [Pseudomonadota bacterium]